ncbi:MAG: elongation factor P [Chlamydiia bacterium]|nr:elongation factor P [Chlamydiia bacterium]
MASKSISPGMTIFVKGKLYRVESSIKVTVPKGTPFIKTKLRELKSNKVVEKNFKPGEEINDVSLKERQLEFLYPEGKDFLFLDKGTLDLVVVPNGIVGNLSCYLKEGVDLVASAYGDEIVSVELPQFLELMVTKVASSEKEDLNAPSMATLETGATVEVPPFIDVGDVIKVDTHLGEYIQRV